MWGDGGRGGENVLGEILQVCLVILVVAARIVFGSPDNGPSPLINNRGLSLGHMVFGAWPVVGPPWQLAPLLPGLGAASMNLQEFSTCADASGGAP